MLLSWTSSSKLIEYQSKLRTFAYKWSRRILFEEIRYEWAHWKADPADIQFMWHTVSESTYLIPCEWYTSRFFTCARLSTMHAVPRWNSYHSRPCGFVQCAFHFGHQWLKNSHSWINTDLTWPYRGIRRCQCCLATGNSRRMVYNHLTGGLWTVVPA